MKKITLMTLSLIIILFFTGCSSKKSESKNMEQIQKEEGIPVRALEMQPKTFTQTLTYNAQLLGIEESLVKSSVGDVVVKVNAKVGDYVKKDQVILLFPQDSPSAQFLQASSAFQNSKTTYERMQRLFLQGAISQQDIDNFRTAYTVAQANLNASDQMINVKAPISGYVTSIFVNQGDNVENGADLFTISNTSKFKAIVWVPDSEIKVIKKGQHAQATWNDVVLTGKVFSSALAMDNKTKAFRTEIIFNPNSKFITSGVTVEISIETLKINDALTIEKKSIIESEGKQYVWLVVDGKALKREITTKHDNGIEYEVSSGLVQGDKLITEGITMVYDGSLVRVVE